MSSMNRIALGSVLALVAAGVAVSWGTPPIQLPGDGSSFPHLVIAEDEFQVLGRVQGLYPGARRELPLMVVNRTGNPMRVTAIRVRVGDANAGCASATLVPTSFRGSMRVPAGSIRRLRLPIRMRVSAPDACQGASYPLAFIGRRE
jgi:hypothetical protein